MKHYLLLYCLLVGIHVLGMDAPAAQKEVSKPTAVVVQDSSSAAIASAKEDARRFEKYDLDYPEKFLISLKNELSDPIILEAYANNLQYFATLLLLQNEIFSKLYVMMTIDNKIASLEKANEALSKEIKREKITTTKSVSTYKLFPHTPQDFNVLLHNFSILKTPHYTPKYAQVVFGWILDNQNSSWIKNFGLIKKNDYEVDLLNEVFSVVGDEFITDYGVAGQSLTGIPSKIVNDNTNFLKKVVSNVAAVQKKMLKQTAEQRARFGVSNFFSMMRPNVSIIQAYIFNHSWYNKLYQLVIKELRTEALKFVRLHPERKLADFLSYEHARKKFLLPASLETPDTVLQKTQISPLEKDFENSQKIWQVINEKRDQELKKKKNKSKKEKIKIESLEQREESAPQIPVSQEEEIQAPVQAMKIKVGDDGSSILEGDETDLRITIHDPKNNTKNIIFKSDKPNQIKQLLSPINYTAWVNQWFADPQQALIDQGYTAQGTKKFTAVHLRWKPIALHSFARLVDDYIKEWGTLTTISNRKDPRRQDLLVTIPGSIIYPDGKEESGVYAYLIDSSNGQWYHRMFEPQTGQKLINDLFEKGYFSPDMQGYYDVYFPPLGAKK